MVLELLLTPDKAGNQISIESAIREHLGLSDDAKLYYRLIKKSIDARKFPVRVLLKIEVNLSQPLEKQLEHTWQYQNVKQGKEVHIIGAGPAGLFAALQCIQLGMKPIIFERGKSVRDRRRDLALLNREGILNEESNYCFGEGGAGTYSDGKLYTRSKKRGDIQQILQWFCQFGADESIIYEAHPHIGTNKLPQIIEQMRQAILECGGEVHFQNKLTNIEIENNNITRIEINHNSWITVRHLVLATGHSADDIYLLLDRNGVLLESKPFALGVRIEHPQELIDQIQYHCESRGDYLPPASYGLVDQYKGRGVFSFCMCPGGIIAPASTHHGRLVVNGWSPSRRNNKFANSGMVVSVMPSDFENYSPLAGLRFQEAVESKAFNSGGGKFVAPAQRMTDFVKGRISKTLPSCSYLPGVRSANLQDILPEFVYYGLKQGFNNFGKKMKTKNGLHSYMTEEAIVVATESRTSSPVKIPRDKVSLKHIQIENLFPCAEGAGYAGGIVSAAMDGINVVKAISISYK